MSSKSEGLFTVRYYFQMSGGTQVIPELKSSTTAFQLLIDPVQLIAVQSGGRLIKSNPTIIRRRCTVASLRSVVPICNVREQPMLSILCELLSGNGSQGLVLYAHCFVGGPRATM
ncbi:UNVERIFIED_CONTAM: hypothetical protein Slati_0189200 [Sesamum latifolium]|uniref:Uncharacterized protein n=1 Tax=Sesamum latifolium TaxID=2727402 RepID=A0AAW2YAT7_9LAMI